MTRLEKTVLVTDVIVFIIALCSYYVKKSWVVFSMAGCPFSSWLRL